MKDKLSAIVFSLFLIFPFFSCQKECDLPLTDCSALHFNDGLYEEGVRDPSTFIEKVVLNDNCLEIFVSYSGGCEDHYLDLAVIGWQKTDPPQVTASIIHDNQDPCEAILRDTIEFDLFELKYENNNELVINLDGWDDPIMHSFIE